MSGFLNKVQLIGNLGRDPEVRSTQSGKKVVTLNIATGESWKDASGNKVERTEWHRVVIWNEGLGDIAEKYLAKGAKVYVEGKLTTRKWQDQDGNGACPKFCVRGITNAEEAYYAKQSQEG